MDDLISRQAAIDAINAKADEIYETKKKGATYPHDDFFQGMAYAVDIVNALPSVQPERNFLSGLTTEEQYNKINWLLHDYGMRYTDTRQAVIYWLEKHLTQSEQLEPCELCSNLEEGDTLYQSSDLDGGIGFDYIRDIYYCPVCGRRLKDG